MKYSLFFLFLFFQYCSPVFEELKIGTNKWPGYEPLYLSRHRGQFENKPIHLVEFDSSSQVLRFLRNKKLNSAGLTLDEAIFLKDQGINIKIIMIMDISNGADILIARKGISSVLDLKGKRVGVENTAMGAYYLARILNKYDLSVKDLEVIHLEVQDHLKSFESNKVDALVSFSSFESQFHRMGGNVIFDSSMIPGEITDVLIVDQEYLKQNRPIVKSLLRIWFKTIESKNFTSDESIQYMAKRDGISLEDFRSVSHKLIIPNLKENFGLLTGDETGFRKAFDGLVSHMLNSNLITKPLKYDDMIDNRIIQELYYEVK